MVATRAMWMDLEEGKQYNKPLQNAEFLTEEKEQGLNGSEFYYKRIILQLRFAQELAFAFENSFSFSILLIDK